MERREVMAVYPDEAQARRAADALQRNGITSEVRVGEQADEQQALRNEMQEEMEHTFAGPGNVGPFTKEMAKGSSVGTLAAAAFGAVGALPFGLLEFGPTLWQRFVIAAVVGAVAGATVGFVAGGGLSVVGPAAAPLSAEKGVTLAVQVPAGDDTERVARLLVEGNPLRVDITDLDGRVVDTVRTDDGESVPHEMGRTLAQGAEDARRPESSR